MILIIAGIFAIVAALFFSGKGSFLIAGYNTASNEVKMRFHKKRLCKSMGVTFALIALIMVVVDVFMNQLGKLAMPILFWGILLVVVIEIVIMNTICRLKEGEVNEAETPRSTSSTIVGIGIATVIFVLVIVALVWPENLNIQVTDSAVEIDCASWPDVKVELEDITKVSIKDHIQRGKRTNGYGSAYLYEGTFNNVNYGEYQLYVYKDCLPSVILHTKDGVVALNRKTEKDTKKLYHEIVDAINGN